MLEHVPAWLQSRCRVQGTQSNLHGMILYWMRVAMRDHENPALDVALSLAHKLNLPVQVVQVLSERYPYASDRHHTFILEGARDVARALAARQIPYAFHLERPGARNPVLRELAARAFAVVTELMPVEPLRSWTRALAKTAAVIEVDASCLLPMTTGLKEAPARAFEFRAASAHAIAQTLADGYPVFPHDRFSAWHSPEEALPFEPVDLERSRVEDLVAKAEIDHGVAPVPDSPGGMVAGYRRWCAYLEDGLSRYAATRNDPLADTTSRMSAYLHYGQVSPFRLAGDLYARLASNPGAEKLLDELSIWRELGFHHAFHTEDHALVSSLPDWARATLKAHEADARTSLPSWEELAHARTEDPFWNACQRSLLAHGELHNNTRMTWGKRVLSWSETAEDALSLLLDLNHRYALDGRDPASYAGIRWCLGAFDRPFAPEVPVLGTVRPRPTDVHAERLPVAAFDAWVRRSPFKHKPKIAVVGSGVAGLAAARALHNHNLDVVVLDKGRRSGGRLVSRELLGVPFDYGAQYFTAKRPQFRQMVEALAWEDELAVWAPRTVHLAQDSVQPASAKWVGAPWYVAPQGFSAFMSRLSRGLDVRQSVEVTSCERAQATERAPWTLTLADGSTMVVDELLVTVPGPQLEPILGRSVVLSHAHAPCWSLSLAFHATLPVPFDAANVEGSALAWICRETSKPSRTSATHDIWTLHASTAFSEANLEADRGFVEQEMIRAFFSLPCLRDHAATAIATSHLHRWRFARALSTATTNEAAHIYERGLGIAGDAFGGPRVESAYLSGLALAGDLLRTLACEGPGPRKG